VTAQTIAAEPTRTVSHPWLAFLGRRLSRFVVSLFVLISAVFAMVHLTPGDPVRNALGLKADPSLLAARRHELGLDRSLPHQYLDYLHSLTTGHFGTSLISGLRVRDLMTRLMPATAELAIVAFVVAIGVAIPLGMAVAIATRDGKRHKLHIMFAAVTGMFSAIPDFLLGVGLVFLLAVSFKAFPVAGRDGPQSYVLPVAALAAGPAAILSRIVRVETQRVLREEYLRTARSKRLPARLLYLRHALPNLLTATLTVSGLVLAALLAGTVLVENVFAWPGLGQQLVQSVLAKDYPIVQAMALFFGAAVLLINLAVDIAIAVIDPRSTIRDG
jgi:ABC-type dipeptide/oligopeptide/nickel transport system permease component